MDITALSRRQHGVLSRRQALESGLTRGAVEHRLSSGRWRRLHPGIYLTSNGEPSWLARASAVLLHAGPGAALALDSAAYHWRITARRPTVVTVVIPWERRAVAVSGSRVLRSRSVLSLSVQGLRATRVATTVIDMAGRPDLSDGDVVALAARTCQLGRTTAPQLLAELRSRRAHPRRDLLEVALGDVGDGVESTGEFRFLRDVARRHGLPRLLSQTPTGDGSGRRDFESVEHGVIVEIDGFRWHQETFRRDRMRDRAAARDGKVTLRATWLDVAVEPCELAIDVGLSLQRRGWTGRLVPCSSSCPVQDLT